VYQSYRLEVRDAGGHSSLPRPNNAIYRLASGLGRLEKFEFPVELNAVTRPFFERVMASESPEVAAAIKALLAGRTDAQGLAPLTQRFVYNAQLRTTCVATQLEAGHAENALPQTARATVNCRIMPGDRVEDVEAALVRVMNDPKIVVKPIGKAVASAPSPMNPEVMRAVERISAEMWPEVPVIPTMSTGYTDSRWLRTAGIPAYGVSGLFVDPAKSGTHGLNEQIGVKELYAGKEFLYRLVKALSTANRTN
jgi:acetylornithine deacetylase/succinyl-diaminopimelate desuccinylase-like protein